MNIVIEIWQRCFLAAPQMCSGMTCRRCQTALFANQKNFLHLQQDISRDPDEVIRYVQRPRPEPHRKVNIRRAFPGQIERDDLSGTVPSCLLCFHRCDAVLDLLVRPTLDPDRHHDQFSGPEFTIIPMISLQRIPIFPRIPGPVLRLGLRGRRGVPGRLSFWI